VCVQGLLWCDTVRGFGVACVVGGFRGLIRFLME